MTQIKKIIEALKTGIKTRTYQTRFHIACDFPQEAVEQMIDEIMADFSALESSSEPEQVSAEEICVTGCMMVTGGEIKHHKDCPFYPESYSKMYDDLLIEVASLRQHQDKDCKSELIKFKEWYDKLSPASKCTVHPPAGSGGSYGLYNMSDEDLVDSYIRKSKTQK